MMAHRRFQQNRLLGPQESRGDTSGGWVRRHYRPSPFSHGLQDFRNTRKRYRGVLLVLLSRLALQPEQQVHKPLRVREGDQMASRKHLCVHLQAVPSEASLELKGEEAVVH